MESFTKLKYKTLFLYFFLLISIQLHAQQIINYEDAVRQSNESLINRVNAIINSSDYFLLSNNSQQRNSYQNFEILDVNYNNLQLINQINSSQLQNLKYCILRISNNLNPIDLNALNLLSNLELIHIIIETDFSSIPSVINLNNPNIIVTYIISIPQ